MSIQILLRLHGMHYCLIGAIRFLIGVIKQSGGESCLPDQLLHL